MLQLNVNLSTAAKLCGKLKEKQYDNHEEKKDTDIKILRIEKDS